MTDTPSSTSPVLASNLAALQHGPRPLPLFLSLLWRETEGDEQFRTEALAGLRRYQHAARPPRIESGRSVASRGRVRLLGYGTDSTGRGRAGRVPVVFIPSLINPPDVLDIAPDKSLLRYLAARGHDIFRIDWGTPASLDRGQDIGAHVQQLLLPLVRRFQRPPILVGYCLGGTIAIAAAALHHCTALATIATPWFFDAYPQAFRDQTQKAWLDNEPACRQLGVMPMELLQAGFWSMDARRTIRKYADFGLLGDDDPRMAAFLRLEDWANEGAPLTYAAGNQLLNDFYGNNIAGNGQWTLSGHRIDPATLTIPTLAIRSETDRVVPAEATPPAHDNMSLTLGHVGMIVGRQARENLWASLSEWLEIKGG